MLTVSSQVMDGFLAKGLGQLHHRIISGWHERLLQSAHEIGEAGRNAILSDIDELAKDDSTLTMSELQALADLCLVSASNKIRSAGK